MPSALDVVDVYRSADTDRNEATVKYLNEKTSRCNNLKSCFAVGLVCVWSMFGFS